MNETPTQVVNNSTEKYSELNTTLSNIQSTLEQIKILESLPRKEDLRSVGAISATDQFIEYKPTIDQSIKLFHEKLEESEQSALKVLTLLRSITGYSSEEETNTAKAFIAQRQ